MWVARVHYVCVTYKKGASAAQLTTFMRSYEVRTTYVYLRMPAYLCSTYLKQLILITLDRSLFERGLRGERSQTFSYMLNAKQGSIWYHVYKKIWYDAVGDRNHDLPLTGRTLYHWATAAGVWTYAHKRRCQML